MKRTPLRIIVISLLGILLITEFFVFTNNTSAQSTTISLSPSLYNGVNNITSNNSQVAYSLVIRNSTPNVFPGDSLEIEVFISGYGIPLKNKLVGVWSSPYVIDQTDAGYYIGNNITKTGIDSKGIIISFEQIFFLFDPSSRTYPSFAYSQMMGEWVGDNNTPPLLFHINTSKTAASGDYEITFIFTYNDEQNINQDCKTTKFHIIGWWEIWQPIFTGIGIFIALFALIITTKFSYLNLKNNKNKKIKRILRRLRKFFIS